MAANVEKSIKISKGRIGRGFAFFICDTMYRSDKLFVFSINMDFSVEKYLLVVPYD